MEPRHRCHLWSRSTPTTREIGHC